MTGAPEGGGAGVARGQDAAAAAGQPSAARPPAVPATPPRVSIGLPVYNGENYVAEAIGAFLAQTYGDFELIVSDNASTDRTEEICRRFAAQDPRVRYVRNERNLGAAPNYTRVFALSRGELFKWAAHDDVCKPDYLRRCVEALDAHPDVVLCHSKTITVDHDGKFLKDWPPRAELWAAAPHVRFAVFLNSIEPHQIWGLMRKDVLGKTKLLGSYAAHDLPLLADMALRGRFHEVPEVLFLHREHGERSVRVHDFRKPHEAVGWYDTRKGGKLVFPSWRLLAEYAGALRRAPLPLRERMRCLRELARWTARNRGGLTGDVTNAAERVPLLGRAVRGARGRLAGARWQKAGRRLARAVAAVVPPGVGLVLVDEGMFGAREFAAWRTKPFLERDGAYWGLPPSDEVAIAELERMRGEGAQWIAFPTASAWMLDYYDAFHRHLAERYRRVPAGEGLVVFDLR